MAVAVELVKAKTFELDPAKKYLIVFSTYDLSMEDAHNLRKQLKAEGITGIGIGIRQENTDNIKIVETK